MARGRLSHITTSPPPPEDPEYTKWAQRDSLVISWIIGNIDPQLQNQFLDYPTARDLWKGIETLYGGRKDDLQIYDLTVKAGERKQGTEPVETYYGKLTAIWKEIDRRLPNPMKNPEDKTTYNRIVQNNRLYQFLAGLDHSLDKDRRDLLNRDPLPTPEEAFAAIRREATRRGIMKTTSISSSSQSSEIGSGFTAKGRTERPNFRREDERSGLKCTHCGGTRHTKEGCFKIIGYPEWWHERKKKGEKGGGKAAMVNSEEAANKEGSKEEAREDNHGRGIAASTITGISEKRGEEQAIEQTSGYGRGCGRDVNGYQRQLLDEVEIRELLTDHVGHRCCWGSRPARIWKIQMVEDCNVYVGTLDTFIEEREVINERLPYHGGNIDGKNSGLEPGIWELDLRSQFPVLFTPEKETRIKVPHSEVIEKCPGCDGRGDTPCLTCNADQEPAYYKEKMNPCNSCYGRGLIAHRDGSDTICMQCNGKGKIPCATCSSCGLVKCTICQGSGSLLARSIAIIKWKTLSTRKVSATKGAASVPDDVFHRAKGEKLCNMQAYQCTPAFFADSYFLNKFSSEVIADRAPVQPTARVICERHTISVVPVTRITMSHSSRTFSFYIIGFSREVYLKDRYPARICWGLCPCLEWLKI